MKMIVTSVLLIVSAFFLSAQNCTYFINKTDPYTKIHNKTITPQLIHFNSEIYTLLFSLTKVSNDSSSRKFIVVYYSIPLSNVCINETCNLMFLMRDSSIVDIPYNDKIECAKLSMSSVAGITYSSGSCSFELSDSIIARLQTQPFINVRINHLDGFFDYPIATSIKKTSITKYYDLSLNPQDFFINFIKCITN